MPPNFPDGKSLSRTGRDSTLNLCNRRGSDRANNDSARLQRLVCLISLSRSSRAKSHVVISHHTTVNKVALCKWLAYMNLEKRNTRTPAAPHRRPRPPQHQDGRGWSRGRQNRAGERCWRPRTASQPPRRRHLALVAPRRRPLSGTPRAIVDTERQWHLNLSDLIWLNA